MIGLRLMARYLGYKVKLGRLNVPEAVLRQSMPVSTFVGPACSVFVTIESLPVHDEPNYV
jgi:hypothetical protein